MSWRIHWVILKTCVSERFVYRGDFAFATLLRFMPIVTQVFLWSAIFAAGTSDERKELNGYTYSNMVAYYLLAMVGRAFSSMPGLASGIAREVRDGTVKKYLTQPIDMLGYLFWHRVAHKLVYYVVAIGPFALVFWLCRGYFSGWPDAFTIVAFVISLELSFLVGFLLEAWIGLIAFWFLEVNSLLFIYMMINYFLSGHMIPLDWIEAAQLLGLPIGEWTRYLPFQYLAYVPAAIMLGKYDHSQLWIELAVEAVWVVVLFVMCRVTLARGVRRYGAFGG